MQNLYTILPQYKYYELHAPPLNDTASSAVKMTDSALDGIQLVLAQETRPIDYWVNLRFQDTPGENISEDTDVLFVSIMRALLAEIVTTVTQARLNNLHKELKLSGKPTQLIEDEEFGVGQGASDP
ncbi:hypothetical protein AYI68_g4838 [Smittium mucronatum]|uniref:Uncharacterized protein n=1 Tax=Smittium mucronatum TaxID=133383 RepID=A0A1R0GVX9_9FUNG|nr:hypothetical protein AYI68_g4838 [Smittium mucronatum]